MFANCFPVSGGYPVEVRWSSGGGPVEVRWRSGGGPVEVRWRSGGGPVVRRWFSGGFPACVRVVYLWCVLCTFPFYLFPWCVVFAVSVCVEGGSLFFSFAFYVLLELVIFVQCGLYVCFVVLLLSSFSFLFFCSRVHLCVCVCVCVCVVFVRLSFVH